MAMLDDAMAPGFKYYVCVAALSTLVTSFQLGILRLLSNSRSIPLCDTSKAKFPDEHSMPIEEPILDSLPNEALEENSFMYPFNCQNIPDISVGEHSWGFRGINKKSYRGVHNGNIVAVKMATYDNNNSRKCIDDGIKHHDDCYHFGDMKLMKDILFSQSLSHPNLLRLLGYCIRSEEMGTKSLERHGLIAVFEFGYDLNPVAMDSWTVEERIDSTLQLVDLVQYFESSPAGEIRLDDLKPKHVLLVEGRIKMYDLDDVTVQKQKCAGEWSEYCNYGVPCKKGVCQHYTPIVNVHRLALVLSDTILPLKHCKQMPKLEAMCRSLYENRITIAELKEALLDIRNDLDQ